MPKKAFSLAQAITEWRQQMMSAGIQSIGVLEELENHLREEIDRQAESGLDAQQAFHSAVGKIGEITTLQTEFSKLTNMKRFQFFRIASYAMGIGLLFGVCLFYFLQPLATTATRHYSTWLGMRNSVSFQQSALNFICRGALGAGFVFSTVATLATILIKRTRNRKKSP